MRGERGIQVHQIFIPKARSIGFAQGYDVHTGEEVRFIGDWKLLVAIRDRIAEVAKYKGKMDELPVAAVEPHQIALSGEKLPTLKESIEPQYAPPMTATERLVARGEWKDKEVEE